MQIPKPFPWQAKLIAEIRELNPRLVVAPIGRRAGKTQGGLLTVITAPRGLLAGYDVAWLGPTEKVIGESRDWFRSWCAPLIVGASPGDLGYKLANGTVIDWWPAGPNAKQPVRSRGYGIILVDEASFLPGLKLLVDAAIRPALAIDEGMLVLIGTPYGKNGSDFYEFYREAQRTGLAYHAPSSVNPLLKATELERLRKVTDELTFRTEYGAEFLDRAGALLRRDQIRKATPAPIETFKTIAIGFDIALSSRQRADWTALVVSGVCQQDRHWILHAVRWQSDWPTTFERVLRYNEAWKPHVIQTEQVAFQEIAIREMIDAGLPVTAIRPSTDKETRWAPIHLRYSLSQIWHSDKLDADYDGELLAFPQSKHDDFVDATVFALTALDRKLRTGWGTDQGSGAHWGRSVLPHERPRTLLYQYDYMTGRSDKPVYLDELVSEAKTDPNEVMTLEKAIVKYVDELVRHYFPQGRESGLGYEIRPGLNVRVNEPIVFFDTQPGGGSGDFLRLLVHMQAAANLDQARAQVEKWLAEKGVKLEAKT